MATKNKIAILDSSALVSLASVVDSLHNTANGVDKLMIADGWRVLLSGEVLAETLNVVGKKIGRADASVTARAILASYQAGDLDLIHGDPNVYERAIKIQSTGLGNPSFVDALVMALADEYQTEYIFGFDATFEKNGYHLPE